MSGDGGRNRAHVGDKPHGVPEAERGAGGDSVHRVAEQSEALLRALVRTAVDAIVTINEAGHIESFNPAAERLFGYRADEVVGEKVNLLMPSPDRERHDHYITQYLETGARKIIGIGREVLGRNKDGRTFPLELAVSEVRLSDRRLFTGFLRDISERKKAEAELAQEKERLAVTLRSIGDGVITADTMGCVLLMNRMAEKLTGWRQNEAEGQRLGAVFQTVDEKNRAACRDPVEETLRAGGMESPAQQCLLLSKDGEERVIVGRGSPIYDRESQVSGVVVVFRDITETQRMETELQKMEKLESIGLLAGGIAHDFNNLLTEIQCNITLAKLSLPAGDSNYEILEDAEKAIIRAKGLTGQLLTFSKGGAPIKEAASISEILAETASFALRGSNVDPRLAISDELWPVEVDRGQISQVIHNLILNADQAMPDGGRLVIEACNASLSAENGFPLEPGKYVRVTIADSGIGIQREHLHKVFDPYFTTKQKGSGLGLAVTYSIVRNHGGHIHVESTVGVGTTFDVFLPASTKQPPKPAEKPKPPAKGEGRVLLMEDNEGLRKAAGKVLRRLGYEVRLARNGEEALSIYGDARENGHPIDVVIMDLTISGGMGGKETIVRLLEMDPQAKAIAASGYSNDPVMARFRQHGFQGVIAKPYGTHELGEILRRVLQGDP